MKASATKKKKTPFHGPDDKDIFLARDTEKQKRMEAKEKAKNLKIWDKKTATSRLPLKKFRDAEIPPADTDKHVFIYTNTEKDIIDRAKNICKERVQLPKGQRSQNAYEFIEQKKEMFLVQLSHNTIQKEIGHLDHKVERKQKALEQSEKLLKEDELEVRNYVEENSSETKKIEALAEKKHQERKQKEDRLKHIDAHITNLRSEYQKNQDVLENLQDHKNFLVKLSDTDFIKEKETDENKKIKEVKEEWIKKHMYDTFEDHIIFAEEIEAQQASTFGKLHYSQLSFML